MYILKLEVRRVFGELLAEVRKDHGDTQIKLAKKLNMAVQTVQSWEQGRNNPSYETLAQICTIYGITSDYLLGLSNVDPAYVQRYRLERFSKEELQEIKSFEDYLIWRRGKNKEPPNPTVK